MPDWTRDDQSQIPDAPETPAPLFAYRALKGILFGSPEYDEEEENNKENVAPVAPIPVSFNAKSNLEIAAQEGTSNQQSFDTRPLSSRIRDLAPPATSPRKRMALLAREVNPENAWLAYTEQTESQCHVQECQRVNLTSCASHRSREVKEQGELASEEDRATQEQS